MNQKKAPLFDKIKTSKNLPSLPHILLKLIEACNNPESTIADISRVIDTDSSLSAKVMRMVNSVHYGLPTKITSVEQALLLLGTDAVKNIAVSAAVFQVFGAAKGDSAFSLKAFWYHSLLCGTLAELIARRTDYDAPEEAFLTGLLHDIGKMILWVNFPKDYTEILRTARTPEDMIASERQRFGAHHGEVGAWMIGRWHLQSFMEDAVLYHHEKVGDIQDALPLVKIVFLANTLCPYSGKISETAQGNGKKLFDFGPADITALISEGEEKVEQIAQSLGMDIVAPESGGDTDEEYEKEVDLLRNVRDFSLLQGTLQNLLQAHGRESILSVISQGLQVLFDVGPAIYLLHDADHNLLVGQEGTDTAKDLLVKELAISLDTQNTLPVQSLLQKTPLDSFGYLKPVDLTILDKQLIRITDNDGILTLHLSQLVSMQRQR